MSDRQIISAVAAAATVFLWYSNRQAIGRDPQGIFHMLAMFGLAAGLAIEAIGIIKQAGFGIGIGVVLMLIMLFVGFCDFLDPRHRY